LIFTDPNCKPCNALLPDIARWERQESGRLTIALISRGTADANRAKGAADELKAILLQKDREVAQAYYAEGTPSAILINTNGLIASPLAIGSDAIVELVARTVSKNDGAKPAPGLLGIQNGSRIGQQVPSFRLPDLEDSFIEGDDLKGLPTLLLFWNPNCGFCQRMLTELKECEQSRSESGLQVLMISTGSVEANRAMQLAARVCLDQRFTVGSGLGVTGTPSALLLDPDGNIASTVAVGSSSVMALLAAAGDVAAGRPVAL
jgi:peroxiredoxin